jgi:hypothetical protein
MAYGIYHGSSYLSWQFEGGKKWGDLDISYRQYLAMQADFQRSRFYGKEYGGLLMDDGSVERFGPELRENYKINHFNMPTDAVAYYHTHWDEPGTTIWVDANGRIADRPGWTGAADRQVTDQYFSPLDMSVPYKAIVINRYDAAYYPGSGSYVTFSPPINRFIWSFYFWR